MKVALARVDAEKLTFPADTFDAVVASFVFCSVPDPIAGVRELWRVTKPGGQAILLEHVLSANPIVAWLMNLANPLLVRMVGANINRRSVENVETGGWAVERVSALWASIFKLIEARKAE